MIWEVTCEFSNRNCSITVSAHVGQHLRVGKAITPPEGLFASAQTIASPMPTATALAVATITAQLQADDVGTSSQSPAVSSLNPNDSLLEDISIEIE